ncbi:polysaccharide deacetylase family protein [Psychromicrobium xiongbiense]|uniref:polysaccharide deacetylase family protein n=1 Tax=Psychromicrobium xiongbiense TaxID=3051184 RepID=UPI0025539132|nr:polysaccharide deacetylase family protein [Psychromicrobium sp. YIM S02556]
MSDAPLPAQRRKPWFWALVAGLAVIVLAGGSFLVYRTVTNASPQAGTGISGESAMIAGVSKPSPTPTAPSAAPTATPTPAEPDIVPDYVLPPIENGMVPVITRIPTQQKVVFLTIDDGGTKTPEIIQVMNQNKVKASLFLAHMFIQNDPEYFKQLTATGSKVEDHTMTHPLNLIQLSYAQQKAEICGMADFEAKTYGRRPVLFRPPGGPYTPSVRKAVADCGMKAIVDWETKANAGRMEYQTGKSLRPGDIVLMHFRPEFAQDFAAFQAAQKAAGLQVVLLEDYLKLA